MYIIAIHIKAGNFDSREGTLGCANATAGTKPGGSWLGDLALPLRVRLVTVFADRKEFHPVVRLV